LPFVIRVLYSVARDDGGGHARYPPEGRAASALISLYLTVPSLPTEASLVPHFPHEKGFSSTALSVFADRIEAFFSLAQEGNLCPKAVWKTL
jgi:hypothetical protein